MSGITVRESTPINFYVAAKGYVLAAQMVFDSHHQDPKRRVATFLPINLLLGFAIELYLKAWLRNAGVPTAALRHRHMGHNLRALDAWAANEGLSELPSWVQLVDALHDGHASFGYRYITDDSVYPVVNLQLAFDTLNQIEVIIDRAIGASASQGLPAV